MLSLLNLLMLLLKVLAGVCLIIEDWKHRRVLVVWLGLYCITAYYALKVFQYGFSHKISFLIAFAIVFGLQGFWYFRCKKIALGKADLILFPVCCLSFSVHILPFFIGLCGALGILFFKLKQSETAPFISIMVVAEWLVLLASIVY